MTFAFNAPLPQRAVVDGWISWNDLGSQPADAAASLRGNRWSWMSSPTNWEYFLGPRPILVLG